MLSPYFIAVQFFFEVVVNSVYIVKMVPRSHAGQNDVNKSSIKYRFGIHNILMSEDLECS
jgi:hypothetical protein